MTEPDPDFDRDLAATVSLVFYCVAVAMICGLVLATGVAGCAPRWPTKPLAVVVTAPVTTKSAVPCILPTLPAEPVIVGWPEPGRIYVSVSDLANLYAYDAALVNWAQEVSKCLVGKMGAEPE